MALVGLEVLGGLDLPVALLSPAARAERPHRPKHLKRIEELARQRRLSHPECRHHRLLNRQAGHWSRWRPGWWLMRLSQRLWT